MRINTVTREIRFLLTLPAPALLMITTTTSSTALYLVTRDLSVLATWRVLL
jgi:hypothetical protein